MSWLVEIAGKAENFLNTLDQQAADALSTTEEGGRRNSKTWRKKDEIPIVDNTLVTSSSSSTYVPASSSSSTTHNHQVNDKTDTSNPAKINGAAKSNNSTLSRSKPRSKPPTKQETQESTSNTNVSKPAALSNGNQNVKSDEELLNFLNSPNQREIDEISLLKSEIATQARETGMILKNYKKLQNDHEAQSKTLDELQKKLAIQTTKVESKESDNSDEIEKLQADIKAKDGELKLIRERLDEALEKLKNMDKLLNIQNRVEQLELENRQAAERNVELEEKVQNLNLQLAAANKNVQGIKESLVVTESEFNIYKEKAKSILRTKDEFIASLKDEKNNHQGQDGSTPVLTEAQIMVEIGSLKNERELLHAEITQNRSFCDSLKDDNRRLEREIHSTRIANLELQETIAKERDITHTIQEENLQLSQNLSALQLELEREKSEKRKLDERVKKLTSENEMGISTMSRSFSGSFNDFNQSNNQIQSSTSRNLNHSPVLMMTNCDSSSIPDERDNLKTRIKALTQSLLEKQSLINNISADKQLLQIRVERLQTQIQEMADSTESNSNGSIPQTVISNQPLYLSESPWDTKIKSKVKRAYSRVDSLFCQFGTAMRHRPNLRLGFSTYILFLHLWVFFVLFYWSHTATMSPHS